MKIVRAYQSKNDIASVFLKEFTRQLIINSKPKSKVDPQVIERVRIKLENKVPLETLIPKQRSQIVTSKPIIRKQVPLRNLQGFMPSKQIPKTNVPFPVQKQTSKVEHIIKDSQTIDFGKLSTFLSDLSVTGVECPGPNKNVLVNKSGLVQTSAVTMSADEMQEILKEFSEKTKIPLIPGIFKALYNNFLITAVISEIAGNRFIIEKHFGQLNLPRKEQ
ncbi:MAG TPA: hypothetical protein VHA12_01985 [Candidatus Nanoarchaeia archaeon]|nr:hypothetical protein [Candidatus Nanoarchaeia archaeon]